MSNRSSSDLFKTGFAENLRRFWPVAFLSFLLLFFSGPYVAIVDDFDRVTDWSRMLLNENVVFMLVHMFIPIAAAVSVFKYLHTPGSVAVMNALPFSRSRLFRANYFAGVALWFAPVLANAIIMMMIGPYAATKIAGWILSSFLIEGAVYALSVFSCCVTGTVVHSFLGSFLFNGIVSVVWLLLYAYESSFVWGLADNNAVLNFIALLHPYSGVVAEAFSGAGGSRLYIAWYFALIAIVSTVSFFLYKRRKMERSGDALAYRGFEPVLSVLIAFIGMSGIAFLFMLRNGTRSDFIVGCLVGLPIAWIIGRMLVMKTIRIFRKKDLVNLAIAAVVCALVVGIFMGDLFRIEEFVPSPASVKSARLGSYTLNNALYETGWSSDGFPGFTEPENIEAVTDLHREIVSRKAELKRDEDDDTYDAWRYRRSITFDYERSLTDLSRRYTVPSSLLAGSSAMKKLFESAENKSRLLIEAQEKALVDSHTSDPSRPAEIVGKRMTVSCPLDNSSFTVLIRTAAELKALQSAMEKDWLALTYEQALADDLTVCYIHTDYTLRIPGNTDRERTLSFRVTPSCTETIRVLKTLGIYDDVALSSDKVVSASVFRHDGYADETGYEVIYDRYGNSHIYYKAYEQYGYTREDVLEGKPLPTMQSYGTIIDMMDSPADELIDTVIPDSLANANVIDLLIRNGHTEPENYTAYQYVILTYKTGEKYADTDKDGDGTLKDVLNYYKFFLPDGYSVK